MMKVLGKIYVLITFINNINGCHGYGLLLKFYKILFFTGMFKAVY